MSPPAKKSFDIEKSSIDIILPFTLYKRVTLILNFCVFSVNKHHYAPFYSIKVKIITKFKNFFEKGIDKLDY